MSARRATAFLAVSFLVASGCSNYRFVRGPYGTVDVPHLIAVLESRKDEPRLREVVWLPLLYRSETTFERTRRSGSGEHGSGEAGFREDGFTFYEMRGVGRAAASSIMTRTASATTWPRRAASATVSPPPPRTGCGARTRTSSTAGARFSSGS
jgi:hypothetical protein